MAKQKINPKDTINLIGEGPLSNLLLNVQDGAFLALVPASLTAERLDVRLHLIDAVLAELEPVREALRLAYVEQERDTAHYRSEESNGQKTLTQPAKLLTIMAQHGFNIQALEQAGALKPDLNSCIKLLASKIPVECPQQNNETAEAYEKRLADEALKLVDGTYSGGKPIIKLHSK